MDNSYTQDDSNNCNLSIKELKLNINNQIGNKLKGYEKNNNKIKENKLPFPITETLILNYSPKNRNPINNLVKSTGKLKQNGKLYKIIDYSLNKKSLGSIPGKTEKILLKDRMVNDRFSDSNSIFSQIKDNNPGVGSYNLNFDWKLKNNSVKMEHSLEKRFPDSYNFLPSVGDYDVDKGKNIQKQRYNLRYNSLYNRPKVLINDNINNDSNDNLLTYNPKNLNEIEKNKKNYNFSSYSGRDQYRGSKIKSFFDKINDYPGPGQYFTNENLPKKKIFHYNITNNSHSNNFEIEKQLNGFSTEKRTILNDENFDKPNFIMKQNGNKRDNKVYNLEDIYKFKTEKKIIINEKEELEKRLRENERKTTSKNLFFNIKQNRELNKIKTLLGNDNGRPDLFYLSPERWENRKTAFKVPGPAYYFY